MYSNTTLTCLEHGYGVKVLDFLCLDLELFGEVQRLQSWIYIHK